MVVITKIPNFGKGRIDQGGPRCFCWTDRKLNFYIMSVNFLLMDSCKYDKDVDNEDDIGSPWSVGHLKVHWSGKWSVPHSRSLTNELAVPTFKVSHPQINLNLFLMLINQSTSWAQHHPEHQPPTHPHPQRQPHLHPHPQSQPQSQLISQPLTSTKASSVTPSSSSQLALLIV